MRKDQSGREMNKPENKELISIVNVKGLIAELKEKRFKKKEVDVEFH